MVPTVIATFMPGEATTRTAAVCLDCAIRRVRYSGVAPMPQETTTVPVDTSKLRLREKADVVVSVSEAEEAGDDGVVTTVARVVNRGPDPARQVQLNDVLERDGELVSAEPSRGTCRTTGRSATCDLGGLAAGASAEILLRVKVDKLVVPKESEGPPAGASAARPDLRARASAGVTPGRHAQSTRRSSASSTTRDPDTSNNSAKTTTKSKCVARLRAGPVALRAGCWRKASKNLWVAKSFATYNGLEVHAPGKLAVNVKALTFAASGTATVKAGPVLLYRGKVDFKLKRDMQFKVASGAKLKGLPISGFVKGDVSPGRVTFKAAVNLPSVLGGAKADAAFRAVDGSGLRLDSLNVSVKRIKVGAVLRVENIGLTYTTSGDEWSSRATVYLPGPKAPTVSARLKLRGGSFKSLSADVNGINRPISVGVFLQSIGFGVAITPFTLDGRMTITGGPRVLGTAAATAKGKMRYRSGTYTVSGELKLVKATLATAVLRYATPSSITLEGTLNQRFGVFGVSSRMKGWLDGRRAFQIDGSAAIAAPGPDASGNGTVSSRGIGACGTGPFGIQVGFRYRWGDKVPRPGCDLGAVQATRAAHAARAAQAGDGSVLLPAGLRQALITVRGAGAPPLVRVTGPDGATVDVTVSGPDAAIEQEPFLAYRIAEEATTYVFIGHPAAGRWTVSPLASSAPISEVTAEVGLPAPKVRASVNAIKSRRARLSWRLRPIAGQRVTFVEQARNVNRVIAVTRRARGSVRFRPAPGSRRRTVVAYVEQDDIPRAELRVTRYVAPASAGERARTFGIVERRS